MHAPATESFMMRRGSGTPSRHGAVNDQQGSAVRGKDGIAEWLHAARRYGKSIISCLPPSDKARMRLPGPRRAYTVPERPALWILRIMVSSIMVSSLAGCRGLLRSGTAAHPEDCQEKQKGQNCDRIPSFHFRLSSPKKPVYQ